MPILLQMIGGCKRFGGQVLLDQAGLALTDADRAGLIGRNGSGKTTLCRILIGEERLDEGELVRHPDLRLGYLRQDDPFFPGETVASFLARDSGKPGWRCAEAAARFEFRGALLDRPVAALSGGWRTRLKLLALLLREPNLLVLDEPTNFLDLRTQLLLEEFLKDFRGGWMVVSHDRAFLRGVCTRTVELARGKIDSFAGDVDAFLEHKGKIRRHDERTNAVLLARAQQLQRFIDKNRYGANTAARAQAKIRQLDRLQEKVKEIQEPEGEVRLRLPQVEPRKGPALRCEGLAIGYPALEVASGISLEIEHGSRVAVVGDNGQGKTTFLRTVAEDLAPRGGGFRWGHGVTRGYYAQLVYESLPGGQTVLQYLDRLAAPGTPPLALRTLAGSFLFEGDAVEKPTDVLSGGERARLCLAGILLGGHNVLLLDEPGNHLDVETVEALSEALSAYRGTVIFTSHDRTFLERMATAVIEVREGRVAQFPGRYEDYLYHIRQEIEDGRGPTPAKPGPGPARPAREEGKAKARRRHELQRDATAVERQIARLEEQRKIRHAQFLQSRDAAEAQRLHGEIEEIQERLRPLEERWIALQEDLERLDGGGPKGEPA
jgi:ATP-binding cassette subfamily F protein 3